MAVSFDTQALSTASRNLIAQAEELQTQATAQFERVMEQIEKAKVDMKHKYDEAMDAYKEVVRLINEAYERELQSYQQAMANFNPTPPNPKPKNWTPPSPPSPPSPPVYPDPPVFDEEGYNQLSERIKDCTAQLENAQKAAIEITAVSECVTNIVAQIEQADADVYSLLKSIDMNLLTTDTAMSAFSTAMFGDAGFSTAYSKYSFRDKDGNWHDVMPEAYNTWGEFAEFARKYGKNALCGLALQKGLSVEAYEKICAKAGVKAYADYADWVKNPQSIIEKNAKLWKITAPETAEITESDVKAKAAGANTVFTVDEDFVYLPSMSVGAIGNYSAHSGSMPIEHQQFLYEICQDANIDYAMALAIILHESGCDPNIKQLSGGPGRGYMQITDGSTEYVWSYFGWFTGQEGSRANPNARFVAKNGFDPSGWLEELQAQGEDVSNILNPYANMLCGVAMLAEWQGTYGDDAYNILYHYGNSTDATTQELLAYQRAIQNQLNEQASK